jgi:hypothetical protein
MQAEDELNRNAILSIAEICQNFSLEMGGRVQPVSAWAMLRKRHNFECSPDVLEVIHEVVLDILAPPPPELDDLPKEPPAPLVQTAVLCPEDRPEMDDCLSEASSGFLEEQKHLTEVFLPDVDAYSDAGCSEPGIEGAENPQDDDEFSPTELLPPLTLPPSTVA